MNAKHLTTAAAVARDAVFYGELIAYRRVTADADDHRYVLGVKTPTAYYTVVTDLEGETNDGGVIVDGNHCHDLELAMGVAQRLAAANLPGRTGSTPRTDAAHADAAYHAAAALRRCEHGWTGPANSRPCGCAS